MKNNNKFNRDPWMSVEPNTDVPEQFERLSAYFDGEATPEECRQIQHLLDTDPEVKRQYLHLHQVRQGLQAMPVPVGESSHRLGQRVFSSLFRSRAKVISLWGSGAIAALFIAGVMNQMPRESQSQTANAPIQTVAPSVVAPSQNNGDEPLIVALNRPVLQIPKLATTTPSDTP